MSAGGARRAGSDCRPCRRSCGSPTTRSRSSRPSSRTSNARRSIRSRKRGLPAAHRGLLRSRTKTSRVASARVAPPSRTTSGSSSFHRPSSATCTTDRCGEVTRFAARHARPRLPGAARAARRRRGPVGARRRGDRPDAQRTGRRARGAAGRKLRPPGLPELENLLSDHLDTRVSVVMSDVGSPRPGRHRVRRPRGPRAHLPPHDRRVGCPDEHNARRRPTPVD